MNNKCTLEEYKGCCCQCEYSTPLMKHPFNKEVGKGRMSEAMGYACIGFFSLGEKVAHFFENEHGMCELFKQKNNGE